MKNIVLLGTVTLAAAFGFAWMSRRNRESTERARRSSISNDKLQQLQECFKSLDAVSELHADVAPRYRNMEAGTH